MRKALLLSGILLCLCLDILHAQTWQSPVFPLNAGVGTGGYNGTYNSIQIVNGNPAIAYYDENRANLMYTRATDASGTTFGIPVRVDGMGDMVGQWASLLVVNGNPAIAYYDATNQDLKYVRASDANGSAWGTPVTLDASGNVGKYISMQIVNGNPAMAYYDVAGDLKYIRASTTSGTLVSDWTAPLTVASANDVGQYASLQIVNGNPAISFYDFSLGDLKYIRATNASGTAWGGAVTVESGGDVGQFSSLQVIDGSPAIAFYDVTNTDLKYVRSTDASGTTWGTSATLDATGTVGQHASLQVVNGNPAIAYLDRTNFKVKFIRATTMQGTLAADWAASSTLEDATYLGQFINLLVVNGNPAISFFHLLNTNYGVVKLKRATDASGTTWAASVNIDGAPPQQGMYTSLAIVNGFPAFAYHDNSNNDLLFMRATNAAGTAWSDPIRLDATGFIGDGISLKIVNGNPAIAYMDAGNGDGKNRLKYIRATDVSGTTWGSPVAVHTGSFINLGEFPSLQVVNGNPAIAYYHRTNTDLYYVRATDASGTTWGTPVSIDGTSADVGQAPSLNVIDGNPAISYYDVTNLDLKYIRATTASGTLASDWGTPVTLDATGNVGLHSSMITVDGNPAISYYDGTNGKLKYVRATTTTGTLSTDWGTPLTLTGAGNNNTSLQVVNGNPAIAYYSNLGKTNYISSNTVTGNLLADWNAATVLVPTGTSGTFSSMITQGTGAAVVSYHTTEQLPVFIASSTFAVLPVTLTIFKGKDVDGVNKLYWETASESNNKGFSIERSMNGIEYEVLAFVNSLAPAGNSNIILQYDYSDNNPPHIAYYRLVQTDWDGKKSISSIVRIKQNGETEFAITQVFPNPSTDLLNIKLNNHGSGSLFLSITDMMGHGIRNTLVPFSKSIQLDTRTIPAGVYYLRLTTKSGDTSTVMFIKK